MAIMKCPECGKKISDSVDKCMYCGKDITQDDKIRAFAKRQKAAKRKKKLIIPLCAIVVIIAYFCITLVVGIIKHSVDYSGTSVEKEGQKIPDGFSKDGYELSNRVLDIYIKFNNAEITEDEARDRLDGFAEQFKQMKDDEYDYTIYLHADFFQSNRASEYEQEIKDILAGKSYYGMTNVGEDCIGLTIISLEMDIKSNSEILSKYDLEQVKDYLKLLERDIEAQEKKHIKDKKYFSRDGNLDLEKKAYELIKKLCNNNGKEPKPILDELNKIKDQATGV